MDGCIYRTKDGECDLYAEGGKYTAFCDLENCNERKPSNADRIRMMSDEELAEFITARHYTPHCPVPQCETDETTDCEQCWLAWLRKKAESEGEDGTI